MRPGLLARFRGFPPLHADFELTQKLACGSDIFVRNPQNLYCVSAVSPRGETLVQQPLKLYLSFGWVLLPEGEGAEGRMRGR
jgi:hypothetical protein